MHRFPLASLVVLIVALVATTVGAQVTQPNGVVMPLDSANGETQLYTLFTSRGEAIDYRADGASAPAVFSPLCEFRATFVLHEAASSLAVGWYNDDPARTAPPSPSEIHTIVPAGAAVGTVITAADIRSNPAYTGGLIGFALTGDQTHYSEARWNPVCTGCSAPAPWIMAVIYRSTTTPSAFYVAFEDGAVGSTPSSFNNDGDYNDYVYFFEGLQCLGGGEACDTGMPGICAAGVNQCSGAGLECLPAVPSRDEACNGLDDDCDGSVDDGELCATGEICDRGVCVGRCMGEFGCAAGLECNADGLCVEAACVAVDCPTGEICRAGSCGGPCSDVTCPAERECRAGRCVDPCAGVTCEASRVCEGGACVDRCDCAGCEDGLACDGESGRCIDASCVGVTCLPGAGTICREGGCVDPCAGAVCPRGQLCEAGDCIVDPTFGADAGAPDAGERDDAGTIASDAGPVGMDGGVLDAGAPRSPPSSGGCACRAVGGGDAPATGVLVALVALALTRRSRRAGGHRAR